MKKIILAILLLSSINAFALIPGSLGDLSDKLLLPMSLLTGGLYNMSLAIGIALLFWKEIDWNCDCDWMICSFLYYFANTNILF